MSKDEYDWTKCKQTIRSEMIDKKRREKKMIQSMENMKKRSVAMKTVMKLIGWTTEEIAVHTIEIKIIKEEVQGDSQDWNDR